MAQIYVKTKEGRVAFYEGKPIPSDKFVAVTDTPYIRRLVEHWEDLELQGGSPKQATGQAPRPKPTERGPTPPVAPGPRTTVQPPPGAHAPGTGAPKPQN